jgi:hypothetical protein
MSLGILLAGAVGGALVWSALRSGNSEAPAAADASLRIEILNGCGSPGAADRVALLLRRAGYVVERTGNADHFHYREDVIAARRVGLEKARPLAAVLEGAAVVEQRIPQYDVDITVVVGKPRSIAASGSD